MLVFDKIFDSDFLFKEIEGEGTSVGSGEGILVIYRMLVGGNFCWFLFF